VCGINIEDINLDELYIIKRKTRKNMLKKLEKRL